jgi:pantoate--beta-alanine ligase
MGALHNGHISLVSGSIREVPLTVVSIYVNPAQFNDKKDLRNYPRTPETDLSLLRNHLREDDILFTPDNNEIYPTEDLRQFDFGNLDKVMEARHRPGHFNGVAKVVSRLFDIVEPDIAYFGQKDFQQIAVIRSLVKQLGYNVRISVMPIIRESDGLAMSSRNTLLDPGIRKNASVIFRTISSAAEMINRKEISEIKKFVINSIESIEGFNVEYFEIADDVELKTIENSSEIIRGRNYFGCIAVKAGKIRLIDNVEIRLR